MLRVLIPLLLGVISVAQAGMNRRVGAEFGWSMAALLNNAVLFGVSLVFYLLNPPSGAFSVRSVSGAAVYALPGMLGITLVLGIPWAVSKWGATLVFVGLIFSQVMGSLWWDATMENRAVSGVRVLGVILSMAGAILVSVRS